MMRWGYVEIAAAFGLCLCLSHLTASAEPAYVSVVRKYVETTVKPMVNVAIVRRQHGSCHNKTSRVRFVKLGSALPGNTLSGVRYGKK